MKSIRMRLTTERTGKGPDVFEGKDTASISGTQTKLKKIDGAFSFEGSVTTSNGEARSITRTVRPDDDAATAEQARADVAAWLDEVGQPPQKAVKAKTAKRAKK